MVLAHSAQAEPTKMSRGHRKSQQQRRGRPATRGSPNEAMRWSELICLSYEQSPLPRSVLLLIRSAPPPCRPWAGAILPRGSGAAPRRRRDSLTRTMSGLERLTCGYDISTFFLALGYCLTSRSAAAARASRQSPRATLTRPSPSAPAACSASSISSRCCTSRTLPR